MSDNGVLIGGYCLLFTRRQSQRSPVSATHVCVQHQIGDASFFHSGAHFLTSGAAFFSGATFFLLAQLFMWSRLYLANDEFRYHR